MARAAAWWRTAAGRAKTPGGWPGENGSLRGSAGFCGEKCTLRAAGAGAVQAGLRPGGDVCGETFPNIPVGLGGRSPACWGEQPRGGVQNTCSRRSLGYERTEGAGGGVANEVKVVDLLCDDAQALDGVEGLYLWAKDLAEDHILYIQGHSVGDGSADPGVPGGGGRRAG